MKPVVFGSVIFFLTIIGISGHLGFSHHHSSDDDQSTDDDKSLFHHQSTVTDNKGSSDSDSESEPSSGRADIPLTFRSFGSPGILGARRPIVSCKCFRLVPCPTLHCGPDQFRYRPNCCCCCPTCVSNQGASGSSIPLIVNKSSKSSNSSGNEIPAEAET